MTHLPSTNGDSGRDADGRFTKGNAGGPGNPHARHVARLRSLIVQSVSDDDLDAVVRGLVRAAKAGEPWAVRELLDRCIGKSKPLADDAGDEPTEVVVRYVVKVPGEE